MGCSGSTRCFPNAPVCCPRSKGCLLDTSAVDEHLLPGVLRSRYSHGHREEEKEVLAVASRSFAGTATCEPERNIEWMLGPERKGCWEDPRRLKQIAWIMRGLIMPLHRSDDCVVLVARTEAGAIGAVCATRPLLQGRKVPTDAEEMVTAARLVTQAGLPGFDSGTMGRWGAVDKVMKKSHHEHAAGDHWYVSVMAVDPSAQGQGLCGKLVRSVSALADWKGVPCYLETGGRKNVAIYERFGYQLVGQYTLKAGSVEPYEEFFAMVRPPARASE